MLSLLKISIIIYIAHGISIARAADVSTYNRGVIEDTIRPQQAIGAQVFLQRCVLCHGAEGKGDGILAKNLAFYPSTDLLEVKYSTTREDVHQITVYGGSQGNMSTLMPPMGNDLTWTQLESVVDFVLLLRNDHKNAVKLLQAAAVQQISRRFGQSVFKNRCVLCHGKYGEGNGRLSKVIKNPPPFDLTASRLNNETMLNIIANGGEALGRSKHMPPWRDELSEIEILSVIKYVKTIRD